MSEQKHPEIEENDIWRELAAREDLMAAIKHLEIISRRRVENIFAGSYRSAFQGLGMDFAEVRPYQLGDEVRWIDWNVSARMDELYIKQYTEERERTVILVWDGSASMDFGSHWRSKREVGAELGMLLALSAAANHDRVGLLIFSDGVDLFIPPGRGRKHTMRMIREILSYHPPPATQNREQINVTTALQFLYRVAPRHAIAFVMSDFLGQSDEVAWQMLARRCEVIPVIIRDLFEASIDLDRETLIRSTIPVSLWLSFAIMSLLWIGFAQLLALPWWWSVSISAVLCGLFALFSHTRNTRAIYLLQDLETSKLHIVDLRKRPSLTIKPGLDSLRESFQRLSLDVIELQTDVDIVSELRRFFARRRRRSVHF
jgi:hypothetical protein